MKKETLILISHICTIISIPLFITSIIITSSFIIGLPILDISYASVICLGLGWAAVIISHICKKEGKNEINI